jgi:hypothetical protein
MPQTDGDGPRARAGAKISIIVYAKKKKKNYLAFLMHEFKIFFFNFFFNSEFKTKCSALGNRCAKMKK